MKSTRRRTAHGIIAWLAFTGALPRLVVAVPAVLLALGVRAATLIAPPPATGIVTGIKLTLVIQLVGCLWLIGALIWL